MAKNGLKLVACLLNISEAKSYDKVEKIARAAISQYDNIQRSDRQLSIETSVLNIFADQLYNRSVITIAGKVFKLLMKSQFFVARQNYKLSQKTRNGWTLII
jgi:glutamate formiminotransferase